jgi:hypothetical protein
MGRRPEATLDSGAFYVINLTAASNALSWVKPALRACAALQARAALHLGEGWLCMFFCWGALLLHSNVRRNYVRRTISTAAGYSALVFWPATCRLSNAWLLVAGSSACKGVCICTSGRWSSAALVSIGLTLDAAYKAQY